MLENSPYLSFVCLFSIVDAVVRIVTTEIHISVRSFQFTLLCLCVCWSTVLLYIQMVGNQTKPKKGICHFKKNV